MNSVNIVGRIARDPELKKSSGGKSYVFYTVAVDSFFNGEKQSQFIPCVAWNNIAENISKYVSKGSLVSIEGSLNVRNDKNEDGSYNNSVNVMTSRIAFLSRPDSKQNVQPSNSLEKNNDDAPQSSDDDAILWDY